MALFNIDKERKKYSYYVKPMKDFGDVVGFAMSGQDAKAVQVYFVKDGVFCVQGFQLDDYKLRIEDPKLLFGQAIEVQAVFANENTNQLRFFVDKAKDRSRPDVSKRSLMTLLLSAGVALLSILIFIAIFALILLFKERKRIKMRGSGNATLVETSNDISNITAL